jgi:hypothetical protein
MDEFVLIIYIALAGLPRIEISFFAGNCLNGKDMKMTARVW